MAIQMELTLNETAPSRGEGIPERALIVTLSGKTGMGRWEKCSWFRLECLRNEG